ncbi:branched-chain amino acid ABC transporter permease [Rhodoplanes sp. TEM]|uniref:Branched-chain amino acid ABC transporter permease n=1 Tax=Rhodoplanes tepidamans TaxID=200616 RepID=A0ABT5J432_RHOTP|nr:MULTISPECIES: branched-chain amino acid ABC transporter permease [Rhodoplanes]MDC7784373.1 branched-chain amino acid ABC transporter permease [Rhodoplanes tepidamans]MDC7983363.1 branched-chain amino acid ABC transporter permease [Rhodoplanes sp. TEM]MDQ0354498.1 branched-chain amino acid transport system permease protein [Rhodoplanes tepidamans]
MAELALVLIAGAKFGAIYALAALGLVVVHKATKTVNFAHGAFAMLGAFSSYLVVVHWQWPYWMAYVLTPPLIGVVAALIEFLILRPLRRADMFTVVIATVFLGIALSEAFRLTYNTELLAVPGMFVGMPFVFHGVFMTQETLWVIAGALVICVACVLLFRYGRLGRGMRAMASNVRGAQLCGYSVDRVYMFAWFLGGAMAGLAGVFVAPVSGVSVELSIAIISAGFVAGVIGGFDSLKGAILGGLLLGVSESLAAAYVSSALKNCISFLLLFVVLMWRPEGLFPETVARRV